MDTARQSVGGPRTALRGALTASLMMLIVGYNNGQNAPRKAPLWVSAPVSRRKGSEGRVSYHPSHFSSDLLGRHPGHPLVPKCPLACAELTPWRIPALRSLFGARHIIPLPHAQTH